MLATEERLCIQRLPGEFGPILRCEGELDRAGARRLLDELVLLEDLGHPALVVNIAGCDRVDVDGILELLHAFKRASERRQRLVVVAGSGEVARLLRFVGFDEVVPTVPTEEVGLRSLRGGGPVASPPASWHEARERTLDRWRAIAAAIDRAPPAETLLQLTSMTALCERAEALCREAHPVMATRCQFCPLFYALGGRLEDVGCRSIVDPLIALLWADDGETARAHVAEVIRTIESMPEPLEP